MKAKTAFSIDPDQLERLREYATGNRISTSAALRIVIDYGFRAMDDNGRDNAAQPRRLVDTAERYTADDSH